MGNQEGDRMAAHDLTLALALASLLVSIVALSLAICTDRDLGDTDRRLAVVERELDRLEGRRQNAPKRVFTNKNK